jgi:hypothetical protein
VVAVYLLLILAVGVVAWLVAVFVAKPGKERAWYIAVGLLILAVCLWIYSGIPVDKR